MKKLKTALLSAFVVTASASRADTSYLLIQGPFGSGGSEATFKWQVNYAPGLLTNGQDLLQAVFGTPVQNGTFTAGSSTYEYFSSGNATQGAGYMDFGITPGILESPFLVSLTLGGTTVTMDSSYSPSYNYYVAGGGSAQSYPNSGSWTYSEDGTATRTLENGSYDAWSFGAYPAAVNGAENTPAVLNFAGATVVNAVPEPSAALLVFCGGGIFTLARRRRS